MARLCSSCIETFESSCILFGERFFVDVIRWGEYLGRVQFIVKCVCKVAYSFDLACIVNIGAANATRSDVVMLFSKFFFLVVSSDYILQSFFIISRTQKNFLTGALMSFLYCLFYVKVSPFLLAPSSTSLHTYGLL